MTAPRPTRVRVTHPRTDSVRTTPRRPTIHELDEQTELGDVYLNSLIRSQRRLAIGICAAVALLLMGLALTGAVIGNLAHHPAVFGIPLPWLILGAGVYPVLIALGWFTVRGAERTESAFVDLVRRR